MDVRLDLEVIVEAEHCYYWMPTFVVASFVVYAIVMDEQAAQYSIDYL